jgi:sugar phosphate isomerase/epimerase
VPGYPLQPKPITPADLVGKAAALGVRLLQIADNLPLYRLADSELAALDERAAGLHIVIELGVRGCDPESLRASVRQAQLLRAPLIRILLDRNHDEPSPDEIVARLQVVLPELERAGITLAIENHDRFRAQTLRRIAERVGHERVGICFDTANSFGCLEGPDAVLAVLAPHVVNLHLKDFVVRRVPHKMGFTIEGRPAGQGQLDIPALLSNLRAAGRNPNVVLELWPPAETSVAASIEKEAVWARESVRYLRRFLSE